MMKIVAVVLCLSVIGTQAILKQSIGGRIIGGNEANAGQFPFAAAIYKQTSTGTYFCAGALINSQWIATAGQCVADAVIFTVRVGSNSLNANDPNALRLATDTYFLHPDYNPDTLEHDVGLIKLRLPITFTDYIKAVSVISTTNLPDGTSVATLGWGQTSDEEAGLVDGLNYVFLVTLSNEECRLAFGNQITDNMVCVDGNYNEGTCRGDLGSPLIQYGGSSLTYLVGLSSWISGNGCESTDPSGFTRIYAYVSWINNVTTSN
ncbi:brachyurin-like [Zophobas morio]|uniref:brachyurin-like n=1 Tax=Zophobas morio TaxID=2755281 RepID=UPI003082E145